MSQDDLVSTMQYFGLVKYWKGKHIVLKNKVCWEMLYVVRTVYVLCTYVMYVYMHYTACV